MSASQSFSEANNDTKNSELGRSATSSLNRAQSLRDEISIAQNQVDTLSKDISSNHGNSLSINKDLTQPILEYIAHQAVNSSPNSESQGHIGYEGARLIMENGGSEREAYIQRFQEENPRYKVQSINSSQSEAALSLQFEAESAKLRESSAVTSHHAQNTTEVLNRGKEGGLDTNTNPKSIQKEVSSFMAHTNDKRLQGKVDIDVQESALQVAEKTSKDKHLTGTVIKNTAVNPL